MFLYPVIMSLGLGTAFTSAIYYLYDMIAKKVRSKLFCSVSVKNDDEVFDWIKYYLKDAGFVKEDTILRASKVPYHLRKEKNKEEVNYFAGYGSHLLKHNGQTLWVVHEGGETLCSGWDRRPHQQEWITIYGLGNNTDNIRSFIDAAVENQMKKDHGKIIIYQLGWIWHRANTKKPRALNSVILDGDNADMLCKDITSFKNSAEWYIEKGVPYRRGYMLYGPPGTGKTSFTQAIAGAMNLNICYLNLSGPGMNDDRLDRELNCAPRNSIILLEDIDGIFTGREHVRGKLGKGGRERPRVTFSGLLNALDGARSQEGSIIFMTTNHIEKLDPALLRPGRCDVKVKLNNASHIQM